MSYQKGTWGFNTTLNANSCQSARDCIVAKQMRPSANNHATKLTEVVKIYFPPQIQTSPVTELQTETCANKKWSKIRKLSCN